MDLTNTRAEQGPRRVEVVPHRNEWASAFEVEAARLGKALSVLRPGIHHIGSTAIPGIFAKPTIDILLEVDRLEDLDPLQRIFEELGYEAMGEFGIAGRRYYRRRDGAGNRTHQAHAFQTGSPGAVRHLAFRDYLIAHPSAARAYSDLKRKLAAQFPSDIEAYMEGKDAFIQRHERLALRWRSS
jgi:GrpB-like predicted nucleotidyltransferase (UPF0157 family)